MPKQSRPGRALRAACIQYKCAHSLTAFLTTYPLSARGIAMSVYTRYYVHHTAVGASAKYRLYAPEPQTNVFMHSIKTASGAMLTALLARSTQYTTLSQIGACPPWLSQGWHH